MCNNCANTIKYRVIEFIIVIGLILIYVVYDKNSYKQNILNIFIIISVCCIIIIKWLSYFIEEKKKN